MNSQLIIFIFASVTLVSCKHNNITHPIKKDLVQAVYASVNLVPKNYYEVISKFPAYVDKILVVNGQTVKKEDVLAVLKNESLDNNLLIAQNNLSLAQKNIDKNSPLLRLAQSEYNAALAKLNSDSVTYFRLHNLPEQNAISKQQLEQGQLNYELSKQNLIKAENNLRNLKDRLNTDVQNARENLGVLEGNINEYILKSEVDGKIYNIDLEIGELVMPNKVLFEIGSDNNFQVELYIDESDINLIKNKQEVFYTLDAFGEKIFKGEVSEIFPSINSVNRTCKIIATIEKSEQFTNGMSVEANIIVERKKNVLVIPREHLINNNRVKLKGKKELQNVNTGISDLEFVEITQGLAEKTDRIIKLHDGEVVGF